MGERRERNKEKTQAAILRAAKRAFSAKGFRGTSIHDIELGSKVSKGLILHHFGSKEKLYRAVRESLNAEYYASLAALERPRGDPAISKTAIRAALRHTKENDAFRRIALWTYLEGRASRAAERGGRGSESDRRFVEALAAAVREGQAAGYLRKDLDARILPFIIKGAIDFWIQQASLVEQLSGDGALDDEAFVEALARLVGS
jgi:AcrR family transcriptional regulator